MVVNLTRVIQNEIRQKSESFKVHIMSEIHCPNVIKLKAFFTGSLAEDELLELEHHLDQCDYCFDYVEQNKFNTLTSMVNDEASDKMTDSKPADSAEIFLNRLKTLSPRDIPGSIDHYHVIRMISTGGNGEVYECLDEKLNRRVALKTIRPQSLSQRSMERFQNEAVIQARLSHKNIVQLFNYGLSDSDIPYIVMELLDGGTLANLIQKGILSPRKSAYLMEKCARGIAFAHNHGVLHRDLKPSNILLTKSKEEGDEHNNFDEEFNLWPKISDFGFAKLFDSSGIMTASGAIVGTPNYMSPEQAAGGFKTLTAKSDTYSLGVILYECLTGRPPFQSDQISLTLRMIQENQPISPRLIQPGIPRDLETICLKCLEKDPRLRYQTVENLAADLRLFLEGKPILARPQPVWQKGWRWCRSNLQATAAIAISSMSAAIVTTILFLGTQSETKLQKLANHNAKLAIIQSEQRSKMEEAGRNQLDFAGLKLFEASMILHNFTNELNNLLSREVHSEQEKKLVKRQFQNEIRKFSLHLLENQHLVPDRTEHLFFTTLNLARAEEMLGQDDKAIENYKQLLELIDKSKSLKKLDHQFFKVMANSGLANIYAKRNENNKAIEILELVWREIITNLKSNSGAENAEKMRTHESEVGLNLYLLYEKNKFHEKSKSLKEELNQLMPGFQNKTEGNLEK